MEKETQNIKLVVYSIFNVNFEGEMQLKGGLMLGDSFVEDSNGKAVTFTSAKFGLNVINGVDLNSMELVLNISEEYL